MAILYAPVAYVSNSSVSSLSFRVCTVGTERGLLVGVGWRGAQSVSSITYVTNSGTQNLSSAASVNGSNLCRAAIWELAEPTAANGLVTVTMSGTPTWMSACALPLLGVDPADLVINSNSASFTDTVSPSLALNPGVSDAYLFGIYVTTSTNPVNNGSQTDLVTIQQSGDAAVYSVAGPVSASTTFGWHVASGPPASTADDGAVLMVGIRPHASSGAAIPTDYYVSASGSDAAAGTAADPWSSHVAFSGSTTGRQGPHALMQGKAYTVHFADGTYTNTSNATTSVVWSAQISGQDSSNPLTYVSDNLWGAVLDGAAGNNIARYFDYTVTATTTLVGAINDTDTTFTLAASTGFPEDEGLIQIDSEKIAYDELDLVTRVVTGAGRGRHSTTAASHSAGATVSNLSTTMRNNVLIMGIGASHVRFVGFRFTDSTTETRTATIGSGVAPIGLKRAGHISASGSNVTLFACAIDNLGVNGFLKGSTTTNQTLDSCVLMNVGFLQPGGTGAGHGLYIENNNTTISNFKRLFLGPHYGFGAQFYGASANTKYVNAENNWFGARIIVGGNINVTLDEMTLIDNDGDCGDASLQIGYLTGNKNKVTATGNYIVGQEIEVAYVKDMTFTGNTVISAAPYVRRLDTSPSELGTVAMTWNNNTYQGAVNQFDDKGTTRTFAAWQTATGYDAASTYSASVPVSNRVVLRQATLDTDIAMCWIYNWAGGTTVSVTVTSLGWSDGDTIQSRWCYDFFNTGAASHNLESHTVSGGAISVNMEASKHSIAVPNGGSALMTTPLPDRGAFMLIRTAAGTPGSGHPTRKRVGGMRFGGTQLPARPGWFG